jgi:hypothetical protein
MPSVCVRMRDDLPERAGPTRTIVRVGVWERAEAFEERFHGRRPIFGIVQWRREVGGRR